MSKILFKTPAESRIYTMIFEKNMGVGETITAINSITANPNDLTIEGSPVIVGQAIQFRLSGGTNLQSYLVSAQVATSQGNTLEYDGIMTVKDGI